MIPLFPRTQAWAQLESLKSRVLAEDLAVVITGVTGWIGRCLVELLVSEDSVFWPERLYLLGSQSGLLRTAAGVALPIKALAESAQSPAFAGRSVVVFHLAFLTKDKVGLFSEAEYLAINEKMRTDLFRCLSHSRCVSYVVASSGAVYDVLLNQGDARQVGLSLYGASKLADEQATAEYFADTDTRVIIPRIFNISGPYINKPETYALASFITATLQGQPIVLKSPKLVYRSYLFLGDLIVVLLRLALDRTRPPLVTFDTTFFPEIENLDLAQKIHELLGARSKIELACPRTGGIDRYLGDPKGMVDILKSLDIVPLDLDGQIRITAEYLRRSLGS